MVPMPSQRRLPKALPCPFGGLQASRWGRASRGRLPSSLVREVRYVFVSIFIYTCCICPSCSSRRNFIGANSALGIGRAAAYLYAENGPKALYICDRDSTHLESYRHEITARHPGTEVHVRAFDAADEAAVRAVVDDAVSRYGRLDVFFANAGIVGPHRAFPEFTKEEFLKVLDVNVTRYVVRLLPKPKLGRSPSGRL